MGQEKVLTRNAPGPQGGDVLLLRSDAVEIDAAGAMKLAPECNGVAPVVLLDGKLYKLVDSLDSLGVSSLKHVRKLVVTAPPTLSPPASRYPARSASDLPLTLSFPRMLPAGASGAFLGSYLAKMWKIATFILMKCEKLPLLS